MEYNLVFVGGLFDASNDENCLQKSSNTTNFAAESYFRKLIGEFLKTENVIVVSSPFLGNFGVETKEKCNDCFIDSDCYFYGKTSTRRIQRLIELVPALLKAFRRASKKINSNLPSVIFVTQPNFLYIVAALKIQKLLPNSKIVQFVPDLPQYSNLSKTNFAVSLLKKTETRFVYKAVKKMDGFVLFTKQMAKIICFGKPYIVVESISSGTPNWLDERSKTESHTIVYTGTLNSSFGIIEFAKAFISVTDGSTILEIAGGGECAEEIAKIVSPNIRFFGSVTPDQARILQKTADVVVNPRSSNSPYCAFSFPSKTMEYIENNGVVACYHLPGIPDEYSNVLFYPKKETQTELANLSIHLCNLPSDKKHSVRERARNLLASKSPKMAAGQIYKLIGELIC